MITLLWLLLLLKAAEVEHLENQPIPQQCVELPPPAKDGQLITCAVPHHGGTAVYTCRDGLVQWASCSVDWVPPRRWQS